MEKENLKNLDTITNNVKSHIKNGTLKNSILIILALAMLILIWGYFYGIVKVPWPKDRLPTFPEKKYQSASDYFEKVKNFQFLDRTYFQQLILNEFDKEKISRSSINNIFQKIEKEFQDKYVIFETIDKSLAITSILYKHQQLVNFFQAKIDSIRNTQYRDYSAYYEIDRYKEKINDCDRLLNFAKKARLYGKVFFPISSEWVTFSFVAGPFARFHRFSNFEYTYSSEELKPVIDDDIFEKTSVDKSKIKQFNFENEEKKFEQIVDQDKRMLDETRSTIEKQIDKRISSERKEVRKYFYNRWYATLLLAITSIMMWFVLIRYFTIIKRSGLPKKSTHEIYFATNSTSLIFRWIGLLIVIIGLIYLILDFFFILFTARSLGALNSLFVFGFVYSIFAPITMVIITVVASWLFVLEAEFICFLSNVYHIVFKKAYENDTN